MTRFKAALLLLGAICLAGAGCSHSTSSGPTRARETITLATFSKAIGNSPYQIAKHFGWFNAEKELMNYDVRYQEFNDRPSISGAFDRGDLQVLYSAEVPAILCRAQGNDIRIVAVSANVDQNILVRKDLPIKTVSDLRGHTIAVLQGTSSHFCLLKILRAFGMTEKDVKLQYMPPAEGKAAFESGKIDAWAVWAPFVEQQEVSGKGRLIAGGDAKINSVMSVARPFETQNRAAVGSVVSVINRAKEWIVAHPQEAQKVISQDLGLDPKVVRTAWPKHNWAAQLDSSFVKDIQEKATFLAKSDKTRSGKGLDAKADLIDTSFVSSSKN